MFNNDNRTEKQIQCAARVRKCRANKKLKETPPLTQKERNKKRHTYKTVLLHVGYHKFGKPVENGFSFNFRPHNEHISINLYYNPYEKDFYYESDNRRVNGGYHCGYFVEGIESILTRVNEYVKYWKEKGINIKIIDERVNTWSGNYIRNTKATLEQILHAENILGLTDIENNRCQPNPETNEYPELDQIDIQLLEYDYEPIPEGGVLCIGNELFIYYPNKGWIRYLEGGKEHHREGVRERK